MTKQRPTPESSDDIDDDVIDALIQRFSESPEIRRLLDNENDELPEFPSYGYRLGKVEPYYAPTGSTAGRSGDASDDTDIRERMERGEAVKMADLVRVTNFDPKNVDRFRAIRRMMS